jgi:hypothetical protein
MSVNKGGYLSDGHYYAPSEKALSFSCLKKLPGLNCYSCPKYFKKDCREFWSKYGVVN